MGSRRLSEKLIGQRFDWVDQAGLPIRPDWSELTAVRRRQQLVAAQRDDSAIFSTEQAESLVDKRVAELMETRPEMRDFLDFFDGQGQRPFEHAMSAQDVEHIKVTLASMEKRLMGENVMGHEAARMSDQIPIWLKVKPGKIRHVQYEKNLGADAPAENDDTQAVADGCTRFGGREGRRRACGSKGGWKIYQQRVH